MYYFKSAVYEFHRQPIRPLVTGARQTTLPAPARHLTLTYDPIDGFTFPRPEMAPIFDALSRSSPPAPEFDEKNKG